MDESNKNDKSPAKSYSKTLNLQKSSFAIKPKFQDVQESAIKSWDEAGLYAKKVSTDFTGKRFVFHDGPPYANGPIHMGHVLNKVLKDVVVRFKGKSGYEVFFRPGWDCHGLPIELKLLKKLGLDSKNVDSIDKVKFKAECRKFAQEWIDVQSKDFKNLGVMAEFENPYKTMSFDYQASIIEVFSKFYEKGLISRREKTVPWCFNCKTTLASAEIEYKDRVDPSCYVLFKTEENSKLKRSLMSSMHDLDVKPDAQISILVWTTTPWTLPFNRALIIKPETQYAIVQWEEGKYFVAGLALIDKIAAQTKTTLKVVAQIQSKDLLGGEVLHPTHPMKVKIVQDHGVSLEDGTAIVHCAPGCGQEDYLIGVREGLEIVCSVDASGCYTNELGLPELVGRTVVEGNKEIIKLLQEQGMLFSLQEINHSYPHCWRCKNGLIFRATRQWFCSLEASKIKQTAVESLAKMEFIPHWGKNRLEGFLQTRTEWCISRQRIWGVPIPAIICKSCDQEYIDEKLIEFARVNIAKEGIEFWDKITVEDIPLDLPKQACQCGTSSWRLEKDILDVWFDSGASNYAVLKKDNIFPADLYLEGSDQHRGWFQTSLFCSLVANDTPPTKSILTHGFIIDEFKNKLSKSSGNAQSAMDLLKTYGTDVLRLWACSTDYQKDVPLSDTALLNASQAYLKIRNTLRFAISNLFDWTEELSAEHVHYTMLDFLILFRLRAIIKKCLESYANYDFTAVFTTVLNFCNTDLSAHYYDSSKDRLYTLAQGDKVRRSGQKTLSLILEFVNNIIAPMTPFLAHEVQEAYLGVPAHKSNLVIVEPFPCIGILDQIIEKTESMLSKSTVLCALVDSFDSARVIELLSEVKSGVHKSIEELRQSGALKSSLESGVQLSFNQSKDEAKVILNLLFALNQSFEKSKRFLEDFLIVSNVEVESCADQDNWFVARAYCLDKQGNFCKCSRCWRWTEDCSEEQICQRCSEVLL